MRSCVPDRRRLRFCFSRVRVGLREMEARAVPPPRRRGVTLAEQMAASSNLRDLLKLRDDEEEEGGGRRQPAPVVVVGRRRTLLDVVDDDNHHHHHHPSTGVEGHRPATSTRTAAAAAPPRAAAAAGGRGGRVSLMALLEQAERQWATTGDTNRRRVAEEHAEASEEGTNNKGCSVAGVGGQCCVCMVRGKGAAFIPCGHTFCRGCARELRASRGRCPLCNAAIHDVLNLF